MADGRADSVTKVEQSPSPTPSTPAKTAPKAVDNGDQAAIAEQQREFAAGGGDGAAANPAPPNDPARRALSQARVEASIAAVRRAERPSPFGVSQFPPLPQPSAPKAKP